MIRHLAVLTVAAVCLTAGNATTVGNDLDKSKETLFEFLLHIFEGEKLDDEFFKLDYDFEAKIKTFECNYKKIVEEFFESYKRGMLPRRHLYSSFYPQHKEEMIKLFRVFYYAPDLWELTSVANWALKHVNEYQFFFALDNAITHRADTQDIGHRHPYRVFPELFFTSDVMKKVYDVKMGVSTSAERVGNNTFIVKGDYSDAYITDNTDNEYKLIYYLEDIRLNEWFYTTGKKITPWMSSKEYKHMPSGKRGSYYYYTHRWLSARYKIERLSHDLDDVEFLDSREPTVTGYSPKMNYPNGLQFPRRNEWTRVPLPMTRYVNELEEYESRIREAIDSGFIMTRKGTLENIRSEEGLNTLGNLIQGNADSCNMDFYGSFDRLIRYVYGSSPQPQHLHRVLPSALENDLTILRDPGFYRLSKKIDDYFTEFLERLGPIAREELAFEGVKINSVSLTGKNIFTYFEWVDTPIDTFRRGNEERPSVIKVRQYRLNHKPFTYKLNITSERDVKASIRIHLGPKYNVRGQNITNNYRNFYEIVVFTHNLKKGDNIFKHKSIINDFAVPYDHTVESLVRLTGEDAVALHKKRHSFPAHLLFPKGKVEGMPVQLFVHTNEFAADFKTPELDTYALLRDDTPLGFPVNRPIREFDMPNMYVLDTKIIHQTEIRSNFENH